MDDSPCLFWLVMNRWVKLRFEEVYVTRAGMITKGHLSVIKTYSVSIPFRPYCIKQISQSPDRLTLAYLFFT